MMTFKDVDLKALFQLMQEYDVAETTIKNGKTEVTVKRNKEPVVLNAGSVIEPSTAAVSEPKSTNADDGIEEKKQEADTAVNNGSPESSQEKYQTVTAPLVGTFYRAAAPDADPFVEVGDRIDAGDVVCIVEAMKSMNEIPSDAGGVVKEICVENAQMVEYDQVLFKIDPSA
jgi:acetyl-CoA carboxylase biotin carboxyl carrier protein